MPSLPLLPIKSHEVYSRYVDQILFDANEEISNSKEQSIQEGLLMLERNEYRYHLEDFLKIVINFLYFRDQEYLEVYLRWRYSYYLSHNIERAFLSIENALVQKIAQHYIKGSFAREVVKVHGHIAALYDLMSQEFVVSSTPMQNSDILRLYTLLLEGERDAFEIEIAQNSPTLKSFCSYFTDTISGVLSRIGEQWELGFITVAHEHRMSAIIKDVVLTQLESFKSTSRKRGKFFLSSVEGEEHTFGMEITAKILHHLGYEVVVLGSKFSLKEILSALYEFRAEHILFITTLPTNLMSVAKSIEEIRREPLPVHPKCYAAGGALRALSDPYDALDCDYFFETFIDFYERFA